MSLSSSLKAFAALLPALRSERSAMLRCYVVGVVSALALAVLTVLTAWGVGHAVVERTLPQPWWWIVLCVLVIARTILTWREMDVSHAVAYRVLARLRMALFDSYSRSVPGRRREHSGRFAAVAMDDIEKLEFFYAHTIAQIATSASIFFIAAIVMVALLPEAALVLCAGACVIAASALCAGQSIRTLGAEEQRARSDLSTRIVDSLGAMREVLSYGLGPRVIDEAAVATRRSMELERRREMLNQLVSSLRDATVTVVVMGVIATSAHAAGILSGVEDPQFSPAVLPALVALALVGISATTDATSTLTELHPLVASAQRVAAGIHRPAVVAPPVRTQAVPSGSLGLRFIDVSFSYDDSTSVLRNWSADVAPGECVGLSGPSGAGKSTLLALAARLWLPTSGRIVLYGTDGSEVPLESIEESELRSAVAVVDQESTLFHGSVRENLVRGTDGIADAELLAALEKVEAEKWLTLDTDLGQGGLRLSGGQRARLCLSRALVRHPRILLVDEVTASLDPRTERVISGVLADYEGTVLVASHRNETLRRASRIVTLSSVHNEQSV